MSPPRERQSVEVRARVLERGDLFAPPRREWTIIDLFAIFRRRRRWIAGCVLTGMLLAGLYCLLATSRYLATGQIEVSRRDPDALGLNSPVAGDAAQTDSDALNTTMTLETDARILQSSTLALMVIHDLGLETTEDYFPNHANGLHVPPWIFFWRTPVEPMTVPLDDAPNRRYAVLKIFASHLKVEPLPGTRLIKIGYSSPDPRLAAAVVNHLIAALQDYTFQSRFQETSQASAWIAAQLSGLKKQTEQLQQVANKLEQGTGIYGEDSSHNLVLARLDALNTALANAEQNRILKQSIYEVAKSGNPDLISGLAGNAVTGSSPAMTNSLALLQTLRGEQAQVQAKIDEDNARYGSAYPMMAELHGRLDGINKAIHAEIARIGERAHTDYEIAQRAEDSARNDFEKQKRIAAETNNRAVAYRLARQDADGSQALYHGLQGKLKEAGVLEGLRSTNLVVVNAAMVPPASRPHSPNVPVCFVTAVFGGLFLGCGAALVREATDKSVRSVDDLERSLGISLAGVVADLEPQRGMLHIRRKTRADSDPVELGARELRRSLALPQLSAASQTVLITSPVSGDGKSWLAASLGICLARSGSRVLLVDTDLLSPVLHMLFPVEDERGPGRKRGLAEALMAGGSPEPQPHPKIPGLSLIWASDGSTEAPWYAADLLASARMEHLMDQWRAQYDFILLDSSPILHVPNAALLARLCSRALLVVRYRATTMQAVQRSYRALQQNLADQAYLDVVVNGILESSPDYRAYYGFKGAENRRRVKRHA